MWSNTDKIKYFHKHTGNHGGFTVAYVVKDNGTIEWNYARCNEHDNFSRKIGRNIASGRLNSKKVMNYYYTLSPPEFIGYLSSLSDQKLCQIFPIQYNWF